MPTITVSDETYAALRRLAAERGTTIEEVLLPEHRPRPWPAPDELASPEEIARRLRAGEQLVELARGLLAHLPAGHEVDCSRETIYEGCGE